MEGLLAATRRAEATHFWFRGLRRFARPLVAHAVAGIDRPVIIDCGSGTGANLRWLAEFGQAMGFDRSEAGPAPAGGGRVPAVLRADVSAVPLRDECADLVTSFDVLYALDDTKEHRAVEEMWRLLRPGGMALVNVAALDMLRGPHSILSHEVRRYTRRRLRGLIEGAGFTIVRLTYTNASIFPLVALRRLTQRLRPAADDAPLDEDITVPAAPINALLSGSLAVEAHLMRWFDMPLGSSLLCLARKDASGSRGARS